MALDDKHTRYEAGDTIDGKYRIIGQLGTGGFATVYRAYHLEAQCEIAVKIMHQCDDETFIERFKREATIAEKIHHPHVVKIYGYGFVDSTKQPYIAMQLLEGHDLEEELKKNGPLSPHRMLHLVRPVLEALGIGHQLGIVHKDLKPANLYLIHPGCPDEYLVVLDFGVARSSEYQKLTSTGQIVGTTLYLAPEYIRHQIVTPAIDVYQMGLIISELLTGRTAMQGESFDMLMKHCMGQIQLADFLKTGKAKEVFSVATCVDHKCRYKDCEEFGKALDGIADYFSSDVPLEGGEAQKIATVAPKRETEIQNERLENARLGVTEVMMSPDGLPMDPDSLRAKEVMEAKNSISNVDIVAPADNAPEENMANLETKLISRPDDWPNPQTNAPRDIKAEQKAASVAKTTILEAPKKKSSAGKVILIILLILIGLFALWLCV